jgi:hypothetical protein
VRHQAAVSIIEHEVGKATTKQEISVQRPDGTGESQTQADLLSRCKRIRLWRDASPPNTLIIFNLRIRRNEA